MKKIYFLLLFLSFLCPALAQHDAKSKIGVILPLTGTLAEYGVAARNGIELARKEQGDLFENIEFVYDDSQYDMNKTVSAFRKMQSAGDISLTFVWGANPSNAVASIAEAAKAPLIAYSTERELAKDKRFVVRFCSHAGQHAEAILKYLRSKHLTKFGILKAELVFFNGVVNEMRRLLNSDESLVVHDLSLSEQDFKSIITKLKTEKIDGLVVLLVSGQISALYKQLDQLKFRIDTIGTDFFDSLTEVKQAAGAMSGAIFPAHYVNPAFEKKYRSTYGNDLQLAIAAIAYDFALKSGQVFSRSENAHLSAEQIIQAFKSTALPAGYATDLKLDETVNGYDFRLIMRKVEINGIVNLTE